MKAIFFLFRFLLFIGCLQLTHLTSATWLPFNPGTNGVITDFCIYNNELYVSGQFTQIGGISANGIAVWDGIVWRPIGGVSGEISDMEVYNNHLYVSGEFTQIGTVSANNIAKWDGTDWSEVGGGIYRTGGEPGDGIGDKLKVYNNSLYVAGWIDFAGTIAIKNIAKWDGSNWSPLGTGVDNIVSALEVYDNELYAGGSFSYAGSIHSPGIAKWNDTSWSTVGDGTNGYVIALTNFNNALYLSGAFTQAGTIAASKTAKWDNSTFSALGTGVTGAGAFTMPFSLIGYKNELYAGGSFQTIGGKSASNIARWDGSEWHALENGISDSSAVFNGVNCMLEYNQELYVGGIFDMAGGLSSYNIAKWSGLITSVNSSLQKKSIQVFPNPINPNESLKIILPWTGNGHVKIIDSFGRDVFSEGKGFLSGNLQLELENLSLSKGVYFMHIQYGEENEVIPLVVK